MGVLLVEHDMELVMRVCTHINVLDFGAVLMAGSPAEVRADDRVRAAYLGAADDPEDAGRPTATSGRPTADGRGGPWLSAPVLELRRVHAAYGQIEVLHGIDLAVANGSVLALLGPNGAGKSTTLRVASGQMEPTKGCFHVLGRHANGMRPDKLARAGLCTLPDGRGIFPNLTVTENLRLMTFGGPSRSHVEEMAFARFPRLAERRHQVAGTLSGGEQQMLAMARTLSVEPAVLLLDEISMGLAPMIVAELYELVAQIAAEGVAVILAEQFAATALGVATDVAVVVQGRIVAAGKPDDLPDDLADAYLGGCRRMSRAPLTHATSWRRRPAGCLRRRCSSSPAARGCWPPPSPAGPAGADSHAGRLHGERRWPRPSRPSTSSRTSRSRPRPRSSSTRATPPPRDNFGPTGTATASSLYPGQVVANAGPELALLVPGAPLPPAPVWPIQATSEYPQAPNSGSTDQPGVNMDASSTTNGNTASATLGDDAADGRLRTGPTRRAAPRARATRSPARRPSSASATCRRPRRRWRPSTSANAQASATDMGISILGGFITIGSVTSTATATSDGTTGKVTGSTAVQNMDIAGEQVTVDANGIAAAGQSAPSPLPISTINTRAQASSASPCRSPTPTDKVSGASASRTLDGLKISIDLKTLDAAANQFASLLPGVRSPRSSPSPMPNDQQSPWTWPPCR